MKQAWKQELSAEEAHGAIARDIFACRLQAYLSHHRKIAASLLEVLLPSSATPASPPPPGPTAPSAPSHTQALSSLFGHGAPTQSLPPERAVTAVRAWVSSTSTPQTSRPSGLTVLGQNRSLSSLSAAAAAGAKAAAVASLAAVPPTEVTGPGQDVPPMVVLVPRLLLLCLLCSALLYLLRRRGRRSTRG